MPYALLSALVYILIVGLIIGVVFYLTRFIPDATAQSVTRVALGVIVVIFVLYWLMTMVPVGGPYPRLR